MLTAKLGKHTYARGYKEGSHAHFFGRRDNGEELVKVELGHQAARCPHQHGGPDLRQTAQMVELARHNKPNVVAISLPMHDVFGTSCYGSRGNNNSFGRARGTRCEKYIGRTFGKIKPLQGFLHSPYLFGRGCGRQKHGHCPRNMHGKVANQEVGIASSPKHHAFSLHALVVLGA